MVFTFQTYNISFPRLPFPFLVLPITFHRVQLFPIKCYPFPSPELEFFVSVLAFFLVNDGGLLFCSSTFSNADFFFSISGTFLPSAGIFLAVLTSFPSQWWLFSLHFMSPQHAHNFLVALEFLPILTYFFQLTVYSKDLLISILLSWYFLRTVNMSPENREEIEPHQVNRKLG
jgi:hypothetical protein